MQITIILITGNAENGASWSILIWGISDWSSFVIKQYTFTSTY